MIPVAAGAGDQTSWKPELRAFNDKRPPRHFQSPRRNRGFSMFELVAFIICVAIIYAVGANRFSEYPASAERANFMAVVTQVQTGVNMEVLFGMVSGGNLDQYENANPMELMLEAPSNYIGSFGYVDTAQMPRRVWYFDRNSGELVYLINESDDVYLVENGVEVPTDEIRFHIEVDYREEPDRGLADTGLDTGNAPQAETDREIVGRRRINGIVMRPVTPYNWGRNNVTLSETRFSG
ncbi:MAG: hypothetical protein WDZ76_11135 [Pseudohongiellaceae bacterium]